MFDDITVENIFGKGDISELFYQNYDSDLDGKVEEYCYEILNTNSSDCEVEEISQTKDFKLWLADDIEFHIDELKNKFEELIENNSIVGWREMSVGKKWLEDLKNGKIKKLGTFWSYDEDSAEPQWGYNKKNTVYIRLKGKIDINEIDWTQTFRANLYPSLGEEEKEITMKKHGKIKLLEMRLLEDSTHGEGKLVKLPPEILNRIYLGDSK